MLNYSFGGNFSARLNQNLRQEKGYSYGYHSSVSWFREPSYMVAGGSVQTAVTKESVQETLKEFQEIHQDRPGYQTKKSSGPRWECCAATPPTSSVPARLWDR